MDYFCSYAHGYTFILGGSNIFDVLLLKIEENIFSIESQDLKKKIFFFQIFTKFCDFLNFEISRNSIFQNVYRKNIFSPKKIFFVKRFGSQLFEF